MKSCNGFRSEPRQRPHYDGHGRQGGAVPNGRGARRAWQGCVRKLPQFDISETVFQRWKRAKLQRAKLQGAGDLTCLPEHTRQKIVRQHQIANLRVQHRHVDCRFYRSRLRPEYVRRPFQQPGPPPVDEADARHIAVPARPASSRPSRQPTPPPPARGGQAFGLERRAVFPTRSLAHLAFSLRPAWPPSDRQSTYLRCSDSPSHLRPKHIRIVSGQACRVPPHRLPGTSIARRAGRPGPAP